jgi:TM2 domain-containing membrane protein YozV
MVAKKKVAKKVSKRASAKKSPMKESKALPVLPVNRSSRTYQKSQNIQMRKYRPSRGVAVLGLIINVLLVPGLGTVIGGRTQTGIWQMIVLILGLLISLWGTGFLGILIMLVSWVWALVSSIRILQSDVR